MCKKLLITGLGGFVAGSVIASALPYWQVYAVGRREAGAIKNVESHIFDLRLKDQLTELFCRIKPDAAVHTAAMADIDFCQQNHKLAGEVNIGVTTHLAQLCRDFGTRLVFCSTDSVFDGKKGNYGEEDEPNPVNFYGETKVRAEGVIAQTLSNAVIARLALVIGLPVMGTGNSFLPRIIEKLENGDGVKFPINEIRTPIDVITLGRALVELAGNDFCGVLHLAGNERLTRYDMARQIAYRLGFSTDLIVPINSRDIPDRAPRAEDVSLNNSKAKEVLSTPMRSLMEGLELTLNDNEES